MPDVEDLIKHMDNTPLPSLGSKERCLTIEVSPAEIEAITFLCAFVKSACAHAPFPKIWVHYGKTVEGIEDWAGKILDDDM